MEGEGDTDSLNEAHGEFLSVKCHRIRIGGDFKIKVKIFFDSCAPQSLPLAQVSRPAWGRLFQIRAAIKNTTTTP